MIHVHKISVFEFDNIKNGLQCCILRRQGKLFKPDDFMHLYCDDSGWYLSVIVLHVMCSEYYNRRGLKKGYSIINVKVYSLNELDLIDSSTMQLQLKSMYEST